MASDAPVEPGGSSSASLTAPTTFSAADGPATAGGGFAMAGGGFGLEASSTRGTEDLEARSRARAATGGSVVGKTRQDKTRQDKTRQVGWSGTDEDAVVAQAVEGHLDGLTVIARQAAIDAAAVQPCARTAVPAGHSSAEEGGPGRAEAGSSWHLQGRAELEEAGKQQWMRWVGSGLGLRGGGHRMRSSQ